MNSFPIIGAAYIRVSTEEQTEFSPDSQLKHIREYADNHHIRIPKDYIFIDEGISGRTVSKRPAFQNMIRLARTGNTFQIILVWKFSRFARNRQDSILYKSMLRKDCGIEVISITEPLSNDPTSILVEALLEAMDEYYSINLAQEVTRGMQERFSRGKAISVPPFGYRMGKESFEVHPIQAAWVRYMYEAYASGTSLPRIAAMLQAADVRTNRNNAFQPRSIRYILSNPVYIGKLRRHSSTMCMDGIHPPIIDLSLWEQAQSILKNQINPLSHSNSSDYYLKGLIHCSHCGGTLVHFHKGSAFQCSNYNHGTCSVSHYIKTERLETLVEEQVVPLLPPTLALCLYQNNITAKEKNQIIRQLCEDIVYDNSSKKIRLVLTANHS